MSWPAMLSLRFLPFGVSGTAHAALIAALIVASPLPRLPQAAGETAIEVAMVEEAEAAQDAGVAQQTHTLPEAVSLPETLPEIAAREAPAPEAVPETVPEPAVQPVPKVKARSLARPAPPKAEVPRRVATPRREIAIPNRAMQAAPRATGGEARTMAEGRSAGRGTGRGSAAPGNAASGAAYAGRVRAILQGRANALGIEDHEGAVGVSFVIGASGRMESHAITRSSGSGSVDRMIRAMLASASFPPPPGGRFGGAVTIRIQ